MTEQTGERISCRWMRRLAIVAAVLGCALSTGVAGAQTEQTIELSSKAAVAIEHAKARLADGSYTDAASFIAEALETGPEALLATGTGDSAEGEAPRRGVGVAQVVRELIYGLSSEQRHAWAAAVSADADAALEAARRSGSATRLAEVANRFPGTPSAMAAEALLWATAFEDGRFPEAVERTRFYLADPDVGPEARRLAIVVMAEAAAQTGDGVAVDSAERMLSDLGPGRVTLAGVDREASQWLAEARATLSKMTTAQTSWEMVGGNASQTAVCSRRPDFGGSMAFGQGSDTSGVVWDDRGLPTRRDLLSKATDNGVLTSSVFGGRRVDPAEMAVDDTALVTPQSFVVSRAGELIAYDRISWAELWRVRTAPDGLPFVPVAWPAYGDGRVVVTVSSVPAAQAAQMRQLVMMNPSYLSQQISRQLVAIDEMSGRRLWTWPVVAGRADESPQGGDGKVKELHPLGSPLVYGGRVFVTAVWSQQTECYLVCLNLATGQIEWQRYIGAGLVAGLYPLGTSSDLSVPSTDGRRVYVQSPVGTVAAVDLATGNVAWVRRIVRPETGGRGYMQAMAGEWRGGLGDAPTIVDDVLVVADVFTATLMGLHAVDGSDAWKEPVRLSRGGGAVTVRRIGVLRGVLYVSVDERNVVGYNVADGTVKMETLADARITGRGFVASDGLYVPTEKGVCRIALADGKTEMVYRPAEGELGPTALAPTGEAVLGGGERPCLYGEVADYEQRTKRQFAEHPNEPVWPRRLAELARERRSYEEAEKYLESSIGLAAKLTSVSRSRDEQLMGYRRLARLYTEWAENLYREGRIDEAISRYRTVLRYATSPAAKVMTWMALARAYERGGQRLDAQANYAQVLAQEAAERILLETRTPGLKRAASAEARLALERLRTRTADTAAIRTGLRQDDIALAKVRRVAMKSWASPSEAFGVGGDSLTGLVWVRTNSSVGFGPDGALRWIYEWPTAPGDGAPKVKTVGKTIFLKDMTRVTAQDAETGLVRWQWPGPTGHLLVAAGGDNAAVMMQNLQNANVLVRQRMMASIVDLGGFEANSSQVVLVSMPADMSEALVHGLDAETGKERWALSVGDDGAVALIDDKGAATNKPTHGGRTFAGMAASHSKVAVLTRPSWNELGVSCFSASDGQVLWSARAPLLGNVRANWAGDLLVLASDKGMGAVFEGGKKLWASAAAFDLGMDAQLVGLEDGILVFRNALGLMGLSARTGDVAWQTGGRGVGEEDQARPVARRVVQRIGANGVLQVQVFVNGRPVTEPSQMLADGRLMTVEDGAVVGYDVKTGEVAWRHDGESGEEAVDAAQLAGGMVVASGQAGTHRVLWFLDPSSGKLVGQVDLGVGGMSTSSRRSGMFQSVGEIHVTAIRGGLYVDNDDEMLIVSPDVEPDEASPAAAPDETLPVG